jgi:hypothetical protein
MNQTKDSKDDIQQYPPLGEFNNDQALQQLKKQQKINTAISGTVSLISTGILTTPLHIAAPALMPVFVQRMKNVAKVSNKIIVMSTLLEHFSDIGIEVIPDVPVSKETGIEQIDLFVRIPNEKVYFTICIRKFEKSKVIFNDEKLSLMIRHKRRLKPWNPDPQHYIPKATSWLQKNKGHIFGKASNDKRRPTAKVLVLVGSTQIGKHRSEHYDKVGGKSFVCIKNMSRVFILHHQQDLCSFIESYIKEYGKQASKTTKSQSNNNSKPIHKGKTSKSNKRHRLSRQSSS